MTTIRAVSLSGEDWEGYEQVPYWYYDNYQGVFTSGVDNLIYRMEEAMGYDPGTMELRVSISDCSMPNAMHFQRQEVDNDTDWAIYSTEVGGTNFRVMFCRRIGHVVGGPDHFPPQFWVKILEHKRHDYE